MSVTDTVIKQGIDSGAIAPGKLCTHPKPRMQIDSETRTEHGTSFRVEIRGLVCDTCGHWVGSRAIRRV